MNYPESRCFNCGDRSRVSVMCTVDQPARTCTTPQLRPHAHVECAKCGATWFEPVREYEVEPKRIFTDELPPGMGTGPGSPPPYLLRGRRKQ